MSKKLYANLDFQNMELLNVATYTEDEILAMIGLSTKEINTLNSIIDDNNITTIKTHSSSKIYTDNQNILQEAKDYTDKQMTKLNKEYKVITDISEVVNPNYVYLLKTGGTVEKYILSDDGSPVSLGTETIDLTNIYSKDEVNNDFVKKSDADITYATITTVDNILLKIGNLDNLTTTNTTNLVEAINELKLSNDMLASSFANALEELGKLVGGDL